MVSTTEPPYLMNSATFTRNTLPQRGATGRIGATHRGIVRETDTMKSHGVTLTDAQRAEMDAQRARDVHDHLMSLPDAQYQHELYRIFGKCKPGSTLKIQHQAVDAALDLMARDGKTRNPDDTLALADDEYRARIEEEGQFYKERLDTMDAQQPLPEPTKPPAAKTTAPHWSTDTEKVTAITDRLKAQGIDIDFARNAAGLKPGELLSAFKGSGNDFYRAAEAAHKAAQAKRAADLDDILGPDVPAEPPSQKPAEKAPSSPVTPAPATDVPAPRSDATVTLETAKAGKSEPTPEPVQAAPVLHGEASVVMYPMRSGELIWHGYRWSLTIRTGATAADVRNVFAQWETVLAMPGVELAADARYVEPQPLPQQAVTATPAAPALPTRDAPLPETVATPAAGGAADKKGRVPGQTGTDRVTAIARNETNGKSVIEVYCGGKYSDHKLRRDEDVAMLRAAFPALDIAAMTPGTQYPVTATLTWRVTDKLNDKGTYWRDVVSIVA